MPYSDEPCTFCEAYTAAICQPCWDDYERSHNTCVDEAFDCGAAVAFGLMGMAAAINAKMTGVCAACGTFWMGEQDFETLLRTLEGNPSDEDPGRCGLCGTPCELVRPGKSQLTCTCDDDEPFI